jgi:poly(A)-specific ribonuclease
MGFSFVVEALIKAQKPLIGHNMIYDIIYLYNQCIGPLPPTYNDFIKEWITCFPSLYDTKVLATSAQYFGKTGLGNVFEKCVNDYKIQHKLRIGFDTSNKHFLNYQGSGLDSHAHEAAYDAYMTGYCFANIIKYKENQEIFNADRAE